MQYFVGLTEFNPKPLFESAMLTQFATRFGKEGIERINEEIYRRTRDRQLTRLIATMAAARITARTKAH